MTVYSGTNINPNECYNGRKQLYYTVGHGPSNEEPSGNPGKTGKCLLTVPETLCEGVEKPTTARNALKEGI